MDCVRSEAAAALIVSPAGALGESIQQEGASIEAQIDGHRYHCQNTLRPASSIEKPEEARFADIAQSDKVFDIPLLFFENAKIAGARAPVIKRWRGKRQGKGRRIMFVLKSRCNWMNAGAAVMLGAFLFVGSASMAAPEAEKAAPANKEAAKDAPKEVISESAIKLPKPWSDLSTLTEEQRTKLYDIHHKSLAKVSEIEKQEKADCMAVLTDAQKTELKTAVAQDRKDAAARSLTKKIRSK
jgi:Spy/CpxP family protein refolding chaperone